MRWKLFLNLVGKDSKTIVFLPRNRSSRPCYSGNLKINQGWNYLKISWYYHHACDRIHEIIDDLYEALHKEEGIPWRTGEVEQAMEGLKTAIYHEKI